MNAGYKAIQQAYTTWLDTLGFSDGVVYDYTLRVRNFFEWLQTRHIEAINELNQQHLKDYFTYLTHRPHKRKAGLLNTANLNHHFLAIDKLMECLHHHGMTNAPMPTNHRLKTDEHQRINHIQVLTQSEIKALYSHIENTYPKLHYIDRETKHYQLRLIFTLYYACGLRKSEGYKLTPDDIDFDKRTVFVKKGKGYKDRIIPMSQGVYTTLQDYIYNFRHRLKLPHKRLFIDSTRSLHRHLNHLQSITPNQALQAKRLTLHTLRHSIATHLLQNGMRIENIALFLGHSSLASTQVYTHLV